MQLCSTAAGSPPRLPQADLRQQYHSWGRHNGHAAGSLTEAGFQVWAATVGEHLSSGAAEALVNAHADTSDEDFRAAYLGQRTPLRSPAECVTASAATPRPAPAVALPAAELARVRRAPQLPYRYRFVEPLDSVDWRQHDIVGPVKNQHMNNSPCGCCWVRALQAGRPQGCRARRAAHAWHAQAFATIAAVECVNALVTGQNVALSEQQLIDCDRARNAGSLGRCCGRLMLADPLLPCRALL